MERWIICLITMLVLLSSCNNSSHSQNPLIMQLASASRMERLQATHALLVQGEKILSDLLEASKNADRTLADRLHFIIDQITNNEDVDYFNSIRFDVRSDDKKFTPSYVNQLYPDGFETIFRLQRLEGEAFELQIVLVKGDESSEKELKVGTLKELEEAYPFLEGYLKGSVSLEDPQ